VQLHATGTVLYMYCRYYSSNLNETVNELVGAGLVHKIKLVSIRFTFADSGNVCTTHHTCTHTLNFTQAFDEALDTSPCVVLKRA